MGRYERNGIFSQVEMEKIFSSHVCVIGSGGLGGYILEMLARVGVGKLTCVDGDVFDESNLNRQLFSTVDNVGKVKVWEANKRLAAVNPDVAVHAVHQLMAQENVYDLIGEADLVVDALDSIGARMILQDACEKLKIPLVHGAIAGWYGQVSTILPGDCTLNKIYKDAGDTGIESELGNPSFTPATIASIQVSEALKVLIGKKDILQNKILMVDLLENEFQIITI